MINHLMNITIVRAREGDYKIVTSESGAAPNSFKTIHLM